MKNHVSGNFCCLSLLVFMSLVCTPATFAKNDDDVVVLKNGDRLTGEIKGLQRGELKIKADYMAEAVRLDWARISLVNRKLFTSVIRLLPANSNETANFVIGSPDKTIRVQQLEVIRIIPAEAGFWKSLEGSIDFGFSFTSGNDQYQTELIATTTYRTGNHSLTASIDSAFSGQTQGSTTTRKEFNFNVAWQTEDYEWRRSGRL